MAHLPLQILLQGRVNATPLQEVVECLMTRSFYIIFLILVKTTL